MEPVPSQLEKRYPARGPLQQFRFREPTAFSCFRCGTSKKSKLITIYGDDWSTRLCNGCYGRLLSIYHVKEGAKPDEEAAELLANALLGLLGQQEQREAEQRLAAKESRAKMLSTSAFRFLATAEHVAASLGGTETLEWSPAIIGLCKALEVELVDRVMRPLALACSGQNLSGDRGDRGDRSIARVTRFCATPDRSLRLNSDPWHTFSASSAMRMFAGAASQGAHSWRSQVTGSDLIGSCRQLASKSD